MVAFRQLGLSTVANHISLRCDAKYRLFWGMNGGTLYPDATVEVHSLKHAMVPFAPRLVQKGDLKDDVELIELEDVEQRTGVVLATRTTDEVNSAKLVFGSADILTTGLRPNLGKTFLNDSAKRLAGSTEWIPIKLNQDRLDPVLAKYYLLSAQYVDYAERLLSGKEHPRVADSDVAALRVPFPSIEAQQNLVAKIKALEDGQTAARCALRSPVDVINELLCAEFGYPLREHRERARTQHYTAPFVQMAHGYMLRNSAKFHHPDFELTEQFFSRTPHVRVKSLVAIPPRLGATASKGDFVADGGAYYVHPGATKRQDVIALDDCYQITEQFYELTRRRFGLRTNDIVLNRAGEGTIGKAGLWEIEEPAVLSDFTMRLRPAEHVNSRFLWYFLRSVMFQAQVNREKRGMGNMTNIFPPEVERMLIVDCARARQDSVAKTIDEELARLDALLEGIKAKRREIDRLIDEVVHGERKKKKRSA